jgi:hypothetical protein
VTKEVGSTLGLIGLGRIGLEVAKRATGFDMNILYDDVVRREDAEAQYGLTFTDMDTLLRESDFVSVHVNLKDSTHHLMGDDQFDKMKPSYGRGYNVPIDGLRSPALISHGLQKTANIAFQPTCRRGGSRRAFFAKEEDPSSCCLLGNTLFWLNRLILRTCTLAHLPLLGWRAVVW